MSSADEMAVCNCTAYMMCYGLLMSVMKALYISVIQALNHTLADSTEVHLFAGVT